MVPSVLQLVSSSLQAPVQQQTIRVYVSAPSSMQREVDLLKQVIKVHLRNSNLFIIKPRWFLNRCSFKVASSLCFPEYFQPVISCLVASELILTCSHVLVAASPSQCFPRILTLMFQNSKPKLALWKIQLPCQLWNYSLQKSIFMPNLWLWSIPKRYDYTVGICNN